MSEPPASDTPAHHVDDHASAHDDDHGEGHGHSDEPLGPIDLGAWLAGIGGLAIAVAMAFAFVLSTGDI
jgi:hypothetical protein